MRKNKIDPREYARIHYWLRLNFGHANKCESQTCKGISKSFGWALLHGKKYEKVRENYIRLCKSCHSIYDLTEEGRKAISSWISEYHRTHPNKNKGVYKYPEMACPVCKIRFQPYGKPRMFCSADCRNESTRTRYKLALLSELNKEE